MKNYRLNPFCAAPEMLCRTLVRISLLSACVAMSGCHSSKYYMSRQVSVKTEPEATIFWEDGRKITMADAEGSAKVSLSEYEYRKGNKKIVVAKAGYEPQTASLRKKFNLRVTRNILFPPAFLWAHYTTVSFKKENVVSLPVVSQRLSPVEYLRLADEASSRKKKVKMLRNAIYQDPENQSGMAVMSANRISELYYETKDYTDACYWAECARLIDPADDAYLLNMQRATEAIAAKAEKKRRRAEMWTNIANAASVTLASAAALMPGGNSASADYGGAIAGAKPEAGDRKAVAKAGMTVAESQNINQSRNTYNKWVGQLIDMKTNYERNYNARNRVYIQGQMRQIRERLAKKGVKISKSEWEDWDGSL